MSKFKQRFFKTLLKEDSAEYDAMLSTLDKDTDPSEFDAEPMPEGEDPSALVAKASAARNQQMIADITGWVSELDRFVKFINGSEGNSIQSTLAGAEPDTILDKMKHSEQRKIARVATEIASLAESFRGYLAQSTNTSLKYV